MEKERSRKAGIKEEKTQNNNYASVSSYTIMRVFMPNCSTPVGMLLDAPSKNLQTAR